MIKNLLFDLGGVIMDIRRENCIRAFKELGMESPETFLGEYVQAGPFGDLESGLISPAEFRDKLREFIPFPVSDEQIDRAFNAFLIGIPLHRLRSLRDLRSKYAIYLLSNTNPIMWAQDIDLAFRGEGLTINDYFDGIVTSFEARTMKPGHDIFRKVVQRFGVMPEETLFIDDSAKNLEAAAQLGFRTLLVPPGAEFDVLLKENGIG